MDREDALRPSCNCKTTKCLQRYCHCFDSLWFCDEGCGCEGCYNRCYNRTLVEEHAELKLKNTPGAFQPKITNDGGPSSSGAEQRRHVNGCTCPKSSCKRNYCECYKNDVACTARCKCVDCQNPHGARGDGAKTHSGGSSGGSSGSAVVLNEPPRPTEAALNENVTASGTPISDVGMFPNLSDNVQAALQVNANSMPQGPTEP